MRDEIMSKEEVEAVRLCNANDGEPSKPTIDVLAATCLAYMDAHERVEGVCAESPAYLMGDDFVVKIAAIRRANALRGEGETDAK